MPVLLDTSVYISALRRGDPSFLATRMGAPDAALWLSAVVLEELYAGARQQDRRILERLEHNFRGIGRVLVPSLNDWTRTGVVLGSLARKHGYEKIGRARLTNDALLAMGAARLGLTLLTANERDFALLAEFRPFQWRVIRTPGARPSRQSRQ